MGMHFKDKVVYQIYPKSFRDSNQDGFGDIRGMIEKLDYLKELGVDLIWSTPFFLSPQKDNGYDVADYYRIDPQFGTMEDVEELIAEGKKRGMGLMFDMVFNHTSTAHEWFQKALAGDKEYQEYYIFKEGEKDNPPTNWISKFGGSAWEYVEELGKWYLHLFDVSQADLNWENPKVREELKNILRFWKEKGVEGFRFDVVNLISKPEIFQDDLEGDGRRFYTDGRHVHEFIHEMAVDAGITDMVTVGEMSSTSLENCVRYSRASEEELAMCFNFHHLKVDYKDGKKWELMPADYKALNALYREWQLGMQEADGWNAVFWCNHDQPRIVSRLGNDKTYWKESAKMLATSVHLLRGTPYIYQGEEIGMTNAYYGDISLYRDVESLNYYEILLQEGKSKEEALHILSHRSRDNSRTPMQWDDTEYGGFSEVEPWLSLPLHHKDIHVKQQRKDADSILNYYKELIRLRKERKTISEGSIEFLDFETEQIFGFYRRYEEEKLLVLCNWKESECEVTLPEKYKKVLGNYEDSRESWEGKISLKPFECCILEK